MRRIVTITLLVAMSLAAVSTTIENRYFALTTPDDSWAVSDDEGAWSRMGARAMISRSDIRRFALDLARIDYLEMPFTPESYLKSQVVERKDIFCKNADSIGAITDTIMLGRQAKTVHFTKHANGHTYLCNATAMTLGFGTLCIIQGRQQGQPNVIGRVVSALEMRCDTTTLHGTDQLVRAAQRVLKRHPVVSTGIDEMKAVAMPDSATLEFTVVAPYLTRDAVEVPLFVQAKRAEWFKARTQGTLTDLLLATAMAERKQLRYVYVDDKGREIGTLLILPEEYQP